MPHIQLIVTGKTEQQALGEALRSVLPPTRGGVLVSWEKAELVYEPACSRLQPVLTRPAALMVTLAKKMLATLARSPHPGQPPPDLVLAIGDVELHNLGQEALLVAHLRAALRQEAKGHPAAGLLRDRGAYHLLRPMVEASFFGDPETLGRAGVAAVHQRPPLRARDVEEFESLDPNDAWTRHCSSQRARNTQHPHWQPERHAKNYLSHLVGRTARSRYRETEEGAHALSTLPWVDVIDTEASPYLRALFDDLAAWFGHPSPLRPALSPAPLAPTHPNATAPADRLLRNL